MKRLGRAFARLRGDADKGAPKAASSGVQGQDATTVAVPWRSSMTWDEFDLRVYPHRGPDRFQFYAEMGSPISVRVEASLPGPGLRVQVFSCEAERETLVRASSDEHGVAELFAAAPVGGMYSVEVGLDPPEERTPSILSAQHRRSSCETAGRRHSTKAGGICRRSSGASLPRGHRRGGRCGCHDRPRGVVGVRP